ncbi:MAG: 50S ribosomal protein L23 [Bacteroidales bacterium]|nr:50S ribosomal protein L23 [Bacteroidales bacterium]
MGIIKKPMVTEKMNLQGEKLNKYAFLVDKKANKLQIREAVEGMYDVTVESVNVLNYGPKLKRRYTKTGIQDGKTSAYKKAIITLIEGDKIDFYSNI